jgi:hypothetical protein
MGLLCLHLLQSSLVFVNTLMIQRILTDPAWTTPMETRDLAALRHLVYHHINPYGLFELNLDARLPPRGYPSGGGPRYLIPGDTNVGFTPRG